MGFRRVIQVVNLVVFLLLVFVAASSIPSHMNLNFFLRLDPVLVLGTGISGRILIPAFIPAVVVLLLTALMGRVFCGYICPMGTTIDGCDRLLGPSSKGRSIPVRLFRIKYYVLTFVLGSSILGVSFLFLGSPLSLITRFYGLLIQPLIALFGHTALRVIQPAAEMLHLDTLVFTDLSTPRFATQFFILIFFILLFGLAKFSPRFWCRYICPSGALMALLSRRPVFRRQVSDACTNCGKCAGSCPMNAIDKKSPDITLHGECLVCRECEKACPVNAISFTRGAARKDSGSRDFLPSRRRFLFAGLAGFGTAAVSLTGLGSLQGKSGPGQVLPAGLVRPPGSVPEIDFLARCVRCGECMIACPNNALQPIGLKAGIEGIFSPALTPRRGACSPACNNCGVVCPTDAIRNLPVHERLWARPGIAVIVKEKCLAWEQKKRCMVCDEVCPFGAVKFRYEPGNPVPVPEVLEDRCSGCGYCEHHCPVMNRAAIIVTPMGALRLKKGSFRKQGEQQGLNISLRHREDIELPVTPDGLQQGPAPGFTE